MKADLEEKTETNDKDISKDKTVENENEDDEIEEKIKEAVYNEKKLDKKFVY